MEQENEKSHSGQAKDKLKNVFYILGIVFSGYIGLQNYYLGIRQSEINHRLDVKDAYKQKGLIGAVDTNGRAAITERERNEKIIEHCKLNPCNLTPELSVLSAGFKVISSDELLIKEH